MALFAGYSMTNDPLPGFFSEGLDLLDLADWGGVALALCFGRRFGALPAIGLMLSPPMGLPPGSSGELLRDLFEKELANLGGCLAACVSVRGRNS